MLRFCSINSGADFTRCFSDYFYADVSLFIRVSSSSSSISSSLLSTVYILDECRAANIAAAAAVADRPLYDMRIATREQRTQAVAYCV